MSRKSLYWLIFVLVSLFSGIYAYYFFADAYPIVSLQISMNREQALSEALELAHQNAWGPDNPESAASFGVDETVRNYVELETGGSQAFSDLIKSGLYSPYTWRIRLFKENETNEVMIRFTPDGKFYGFKEKIAEDAPGAALSADSALSIAREEAVDKWELSFEQYALVEKSKEERPSGRLDHTFTFERANEKIGDGRYRLRLVVSGDKLTEIKYLIKVPETFDKKYEEMRSANETISTISVIAIGLLYILGGIILGLFYLLRQRWLLWKKPLYWGLFVAALQVLVSINQMPLAWMNYDTALSAQGFVMQQILQMVLIFVGLTILFTGAFMAAEGLTRKAFPNQIQLWKIWSKDTAASPQVLQRTIGGFLAVTIFFAFDISLYIFANNVMGWWSPSDALFDPDVLATYFPWLSSIAISMQAGFMEECLFRAVPIAGAALLGERFGNRKAWIIGAFILQALIFGAAHANYPNQPAYARIVELIIPSIAFGLIYLFFGLLPGIILHFAYDVVWFALPLFVSDAGGVWLDRLLIVLLTFIPLWVVLLARLRNKRWQNVPEESYNRSWKPETRQAADIQPKPVSSETRMPATVKNILQLGGLVGIILWLLFTDFQNLTGYFEVERQEAEMLAQKALSDQGIQLDAPWQTLSRVSMPLDQDDRFVWQEGGANVYQKLLGRYLEKPRWEVRFARFKGSVDERSEEYKLFIGQGGKILRMQHILPESFAGASLQEDSARVIAHQFLQKHLHLEPGKIKEVSAVPSKLPNRTDWLFTFADTLNYPLNEGQARIAIKISGDRVTDGYTFVYVPEEWERNERNLLNTKTLLSGVSGMVRFLLLLTAAFMGIIFWSRKQFSVKAFVTMSAVLFMANFVNLFNQYPEIMATFSTAQPINNQKIMFFGLPIIAFLFMAAFIGLVAGFTIHWKRSQETLKTVPSLLLALSAGFFVAGLLAITNLFEPAYQPGWPDYSLSALALPVLAGLGNINSFLTTVTLYIFIFFALDRFTRGWTHKRWIFALLFILSIVLLNRPTNPDVYYWLLTGLAKAILYLLLYIFVFRYQLALVPLTFGGLIILLEIKPAVMNAVPMAIPSTVIGIILIFILAFYWFKLLQNKQI